MKVKPLLPDYEVFYNRTGVALNVEFSNKPFLPIAKRNIPMTMKVTER